MLVYAIDLTTDLRYQKDFSNFRYQDGRQMFGQGTVLLHIPGPLVPLAMMRLGGSFVRGKRIIAHWFWELQELPRSWRSALPYIHEVFVNTRFVAEAVRSISEQAAVHVVAYPMKGPVSRKNREQIEGRFTVLFAFNVLSNFTRKNPCAVIAAFRQAFAEDNQAHLIIKHTNSAFWPKSIELMRDAARDAPNIEFIGETLNTSMMDELYDRTDVVVSLHRSEGLGLVLAEAMLRGIPVVATNWSGSTDFLTSETGIPIGYDLIPVADHQGNYIGDNLVWADPHIDEAVAALRRLRAEPRMRVAIGLAGARAAGHFFDPARFVDCIIKRLQVGSTQ
jgi:glycosyltransferase involved in cell wall biosynthesis